MKKLIRMLLLSSVVLALGACENSDEPRQQEQTEYRPIELAAETRAVVDGGNQFAFKLFDKLTMNAGDENVAYAPFSVFSTLSMLANGDDGEAGDEILELIGYPKGKAGINSLNDYCNTMLSALPALDNSTDCVISNSFICKSKWTLLPGYKDLLKSVFDAEYIGVNDGESITRQVNDWVNGKTSGLIPKILNEELRLDMAVVNAMYFKGEWTTRFDAAKTRTGKFQNADGTVSDVQFMSGSVGADYFENENMTGVSLPFGNGNFEMQVFRSKSGEMPSMDNGLWLSLCGSKEVYKVDVSLPKFSVDFNRDLIEILKNLGLDKATDEECGLKDICEGNPVYLKLVQHAAKFTVDETGAEASAGTAGGLIVTDSLDGKSISFDVPFVYIIRETSTNTILFMGTVTRL